MHAHDARAHALFPGRGVGENLASRRARRGATAGEDRPPTEDAKRISACDIRAETRHVSSSRHSARVPSTRAVFCRVAGYINNAIAKSETLRRRHRSRLGRVVGIDNPERK